MAAIIVSPHPSFVDWPQEASPVSQEGPDEVDRPLRSPESLRGPAILGLTALAQGLRLCGPRDRPTDTLSPEWS